MIAMFMIENESQADDYLKDLLENEEYRSMDEVNRRAQKFIKNETLKDYFINQAKAIFRTKYGDEIE
jgi:hypothetical protein